MPSNRAISGVLPSSRWCCTSGTFSGPCGVATMARYVRKIFAREDPFILEGLVQSFVIKDWRDALLPE